MNPFKMASSVGYSPEDILLFAAKSMPGFEDKIKYALSVGHTSNEILNFLQSSFSTPKALKNYSKGSQQRTLGEVISRKGTEAEKQEFSNIRNKRLNDLLDMDKLTTGAIGAAAGGLLGGPAGAIGGAVAGSSAYDDIMKKYEENINQGGQVSLGEYLKSIIKGGVKGLGTSATVKAAQELYERLKSGNQNTEQSLTDEDDANLVEEQKQIEFQDPTQKQKEVIEAPVVPQPNEQQVENTEQVISNNKQQDDEGKKYFNMLGNANMDKIVVALSNQLSSEDIRGAISKLYGNKAVRSIEKSSKQKFPEVIEKAIEWYRSQQKEADENTASQEPVEVTLEQDIQIHQTQEPQEQQKLSTVVEDQDVKTSKITPSENISIQEESLTPEQPQATPSFEYNAYEKIFSPKEITKKSRRKVKPVAGALKSSNVRGAFYDSDSNKLRVVFAPSSKTKQRGSVYTYDNIDKETFENLSGGKAKPITEGENKFGLWFNKKNPSVGAAFSKFIKKNADKYPYEKVGDSDYTVEENLIAEADRTFLISDIFKPFEEIRKKGRNITKASQLKEIIPNIKQMRDEDVVEMIESIESNLKLKNPATMKRLEKEIKKRVQQ